MRREDFVDDFKALGFSDINIESEFRDSEIKERVACAEKKNGPGVQIEYFISSFYKSSYEHEFPNPLIGLLSIKIRACKADRLATSSPLNALGCLSLLTKEKCISLHHPFSFLLVYEFSNNKLQHEANLTTWKSPTEIIFATIICIIITWHNAGDSHGVFASCWVSRIIQSVLVIAALYLFHPRHFTTSNSFCLHACANLSWRRLSYGTSFKNQFSPMCAQQRNRSERDNQRRIFENN